MKSFTINDVQRFSGVKAHTLRIWERRYTLVHPDRSQGNSRLYTLDELKKILNIVLLKKNGYRISELSKLNTEDLRNKISNLSYEKNKWQSAINDLIINMYTVEPDSFELILDELLLHWSIDILIEKIIFPFLAITHLLWTGNKLSEEHLVVTAIRKKLIFAIESTILETGKIKTVLLFLPDGKQLDLGLFYSYFFLKKRGIRVLYLGIDVTIKNLETIFQVKPPAYLFTYLQPNQHLFAKQLLESINFYAPNTILVIAKYGFDETPFLNDKLIQMEYLEALDFLHSSCK